MKGILKASPGSSLTSLIWPNCRTSAFSRSSTTKIEERPRKTTTTRKGMKNFVLPMISVPLVGGAVAAQLVQRQIRHDAAALAGSDDGLVENRLVDLAQNLLHAFQMKTLARHFGSFGIFRQNRCEAAGVTLGLVDHARAVAFGLFQRLRGLTAGLGQHAVGVGVGLTLQAVAFLFGGLHLAEGVDHLARGVGLVEVDTHDANTAFVVVHRGLNILHRGIGDDATVAV